ncbi:hypothetical protein [Agrococcus sp. ARC_14]|uniref:hypothetical protein n=1 Tax=Agrococcus sp. ARC_14 TaxID=2919927 RepID=UPI001F0542C0|nr:hypothetical protein [Agrococcus sp. ARC_14]MCH1883360.1 hypothetical protein [Agrococcus sp. ARC_14]
MTDAFEARLQRAGRVALDDAAIGTAVAQVVEQTSVERPSRRPRRIVPAIALGAILALGMPVAVAAAVQWGPWRFVTEPDLVVAREWVDAEGTPLGSCEGRIATEGLSADARADAIAYFAGLDLGAIEPDPERVAGALNATGRLDEIGRLIEGAEPDDFDVRHEGELLSADVFTDARILQEALMSTVTMDMTNAITPEHPELQEAGIATLGEIQCVAPEAAQP